MSDTQQTDEQKLMFDERLNARFRDTAHISFLDVPELRSIVVIYDYYRNLNDLPNVSKGLWLSAEGGPVKPIDSMMGSYGAVIQSAAHILNDLFQRHAELQTSLTELSKQILEKQKQLAELKGGTK
jgi:hypothetical protein